MSNPPSVPAWRTGCHCSSCALANRAGLMIFRRRTLSACLPSFWLLTWRISSYLLDWSNFELSMYSFIIRHLVLYSSLTSCYCECSILYTTALSKSCHGDYTVPIYMASYIRLILGVGFPEFVRAHNVGVGNVGQCDLLEHQWWMSRSHQNSDPWRLR